MDAVDIKLNIGKSRELITLCGAGLYDRHGEITEDNTNKSATYNSGYGNAPKSHVRVKKQVMSGE